MIIESHLNVFDAVLTTSEQTGTDVVFGKPFSDDGNVIPESKTPLANTGMKLRVMVSTAITSAATVKLVGKDKVDDSSYKDVAVYTIPVSEAGKIYDFVLPENSPCVLNVKVTGGSAAGKLFVRFEPMSRGY